MALVLDGSTGITSANIADGTIVDADVADVAASKLTGTITNFTSTGIDDNATSTAITIDSSENVGIGVIPEAWHSSFTGLEYGASGAIFAHKTDSEYSMLNNAYYDGAWKYKNTAAASRIAFSAGVDVYTAASGTADSALTWTAAMAINTSGNVGIGVTPQATHSTHDALYVGGNGVWGSYGTQGASGEMDFQHNAYYSTGGNDKYISTDEASKYRQGGGKHTFFTAPSGSAGAAISWTETMRIDSSGNVLIGTTSSSFPSDGFQFLSTNVANFSRSSGVGINMNRAGSDGQTIAFHKAGGYVGHISVTASGTSYTTSSDYRLKTDVQPMTGAITTFKQLKPINFEWIVDGTRVDGFLAHELQEVIPAAATGTKDAMRDEEYEVTPAVEATFDDEGVELTGAVEAVMGTRSVPDMQGIDQAKIVPLLTAALQEAINKIESLETRLTALEGV